MSGRLYIFLFIVTSFILQASSFEFSKAGYWDVPNSPRKITPMNVGWRFSLDGFKTSKVVSVPHCIDEGELGLEASGCVNRQQPAWYRLQFKWTQTRARSFLHFEGIMGKSRISVNGALVSEHFGGFLPIHVEVTQLLKEGDNVIDVWCDNSNDPDFPPGKPQEDLDFVYFGGLYRDVWLVETGASYVCDSDRGGVYVSSRLGDDGRWIVTADVIVGGDVGAEVELFYDGRSVRSPFCPQNPELWTPKKPILHDLEVRVSKNGNVTDAVGVKFGIRDFKLDSRGLTLNGKPYGKLFGVNRHQDFAYVGMALSNSLHWRDAKKFRDAGFVCIRNAHYPQDPAFMDACDALGLFVIETTPGWQFWNSGNPSFEKRVYDDIEKMVRRDRSRASVLMWEPILNETHYPAEFARRAREVVKREARAPNYCACDGISDGSSEYDVVYCNGGCALGDATRATFYREWGDYVDDWNAQNSPSRVERGWGETPMLVQAAHYVMGTKDRDHFRRISQGPDSLFGGCLWHGADHARGYHPDNFTGGILSYVRQRKYAWNAFKAALDDKPYVFVANALSPYSPQYVTIYSNCPYRASWLGRPFHNGDPLDYARLADCNYSFVHGQEGVASNLTLQVDFSDGKQERFTWARRFARILLSLDTEGLEPLADGSDLVVLTATMADKDGVPRRYQNETVRFSAEGPVEIVGTNPQRTSFGEAAVILRLKERATPEQICVKAELVRTGIHVPPPVRIAFTPGMNDCHEIETKHQVHDTSTVERQQDVFGVKE